MCNLIPWTGRPRPARVGADQRCLRNCGRRDLRIRGGPRLRRHRVLRRDGVRAADRRDADTRVGGHARRSAHAAFRCSTSSQGREALGQRASLISKGTALLPRRVCPISMGAALRECPVQHSGVTVWSRTRRASVLCLQPFPIGYCVLTGTERDGDGLVSNHSDWGLPLLGLVVVGCSSGSGTKATMPSCSAPNSTAMTAATASSPQGGWRFAGASVRHVGGRLDYSRRAPVEFV